MESRSGTPIATLRFVRRRVGHTTYLPLSLWILRTESKSRQNGRKPSRNANARGVYLTFPWVHGARGWFARTDSQTVGTEKRKNGIVRPR